MGARAGSRQRSVGSWLGSGRIRPRVPLTGRYAALRPEPAAPLQEPIRARRAVQRLPDSRSPTHLRHASTFLLRQGVNFKFVQELLGHADISLTLNVYSHVLPDMGDAAALAMDDALE